jgi:hypothetical protein
VSWLICSVLTVLYQFSNCDAPGDAAKVTANVLKNRFKTFSAPPGVKFETVCDPNLFSGWFGPANHALGWPPVL